MTFVHYQPEQLSMAKVKGSIPHYQVLKSDSFWFNLITIKEMHTLHTKVCMNTGLTRGVSPSLHFSGLVSK